MMPAPPGETYHGTVGARAEACIEARALFTRRPAVTRCGGLSPVSKSPRRWLDGAAPHLPPTAPLMLQQPPRQPFTAPLCPCPVCQRVRWTGGARSGEEDVGGQMAAGQEG
jgi:hypothetical protein